MYYQLKDIKNMFATGSLKSCVIYDQTEQAWDGFTIGFETVNDQLIFLRSQRDENIKLFKSLESAYKLSKEIGFQNTTVRKAG